MLIACAITDVFTHYKSRFFKMIEAYLSKKLVIFALNNVLSNVRHQLRIISWPFRAAENPSNAICIYNTETSSD